MKNWTLQSLIDGDMTVTAYCHRSACNHSKQLDLVAIRDRLGPDTQAMADDLTPRLKCAVCGGRQIGLIYSPAGNKQRYPRNPYEKAKNG